MIGISGKINGQVKINVKEEEIALLLFMQSSLKILRISNKLINSLIRFLNRLLIMIFRSKVK